MNNISTGSVRAKKKIIPELRFPEFLDEGEWEEKVLSKITDAVFDGTHQTPTYVEDGIPFFSVENIVSGNKNKFISREDYELATCKNKPEKGDILITRIGKIGFSAIVDWDYEFSIYVTLACIKQSKKFNSYYLHCYFQSSTYQNEILSKSLLNAVPCKINMNELRETQVLLPHPQEQQKIASCLSSLDELIAAHNDKLQALKDHKKGLMQNLFPQEGQKVPNYRFPEFEKDGEWTERKLGKVGELVGGGTPSTTNQEYWDGDIQWYTPTEVKNGTLKPSIRSITKNGLKNSSAKLLPQGTILITTRATIGDVAITNCECATNQGFQSLIVKKTEINQFWYFWILQHKHELVRRSSGSTFKEIGKNEIKVIPTLSPKKKEQKKIASCLSAVDELITAQAEKIEQLQQHKKGLMQGLFPKIV